MIKKSIKKIVTLILNKLPIRIIEILLNQKYYQHFFRQSLYPNKEVKLELKNEYFHNNTLLLNKIYHIEIQLINKGWYDRSTLHLFKNLIEEGDVAIDIGANIGAMTIPLANFVGKTGFVLAFEPGDFTHTRLMSNLNLNKKLKERIKVYKTGLSYKRHDSYWMMDPKVSGNAFFSETNGEKMELYPLDDLLKNESSLSKLNFIKIDVEGMELEVIKGSRSLISNFSPYIYFETLSGKSEEINTKIRTLNDLLINEHGYTLYSFNYQKNKLDKLDLQNIPQNTLAVPNSKINSLKQRDLI